MTNDSSKKFSPKMEFAPLGTGDRLIACHLYFSSRSYVEMIWCQVNYFSNYSFLLPG